MKLSLKMKETMYHKVRTRPMPNKFSTFFLKNVEKPHQKVPIGIELPIRFFGVDNKNLTWFFFQIKDRG